MEARNLLETISGLRLFVLKNPAERRHFAQYMASFGAYICFNMFFPLLSGRYLWLPTLFIAFFGATYTITGVIFNLIVWGSAALLVFIMSHLLSGFLFILGIVFTIWLAMMLVYKYGEKTGRTKDLLPLKMSLSAKIGISWGLIMAGMHLLVLALAKEREMSTYLPTLLFGYATGVGLFISGIMANGYFILGFIGILGIPILYLFEPFWAYLLCGFLGLAMCIYSMYVIKKTPLQ